MYALILAGACAAAGLAWGHAGHHPAHGSAAGEAGRYARASARIVTPDVRLVDASGNPVSARDALELDGPVLVNFIFTSCTAICPVMSGTFAQVQQRLSRDGPAVALVSISIDPEHDTPQRLREYAARFDAGPHWRFLTGSSAASLALQRAFSVYRGDKMGHDPVTFIRARRDAPWLRLDGFATAKQIVDEYHRLLAGRAEASLPLPHPH